MISEGTGLDPSTNSGCSVPVEGEAVPRLTARSQDRALHLIRTCSPGSDGQWVSAGFPGRRLSPRINCAGIHPAEPFDHVHLRPRTTSAAESAGVATIA